MKYGRTVDQFNGAAVVPGMKVKEVKVVGLSPHADFHAIPDATVLWLGQMSRSSVLADRFVEAAVKSGKSNEAWIQLQADPKETLSAKDERRHTNGAVAKVEFGPFIGGADPKLANGVV
jgi:hypothetical protein